MYWSCGTARLPRSKHETVASRTLEGKMSPASRLQGIIRQVRHVPRIQAVTSVRVAVAMMALAGLLLSMTPTIARAEGSTREIVLTSGSAEFTTTLRLTFEEPVTFADSQRIVRDLGVTTVSQSQVAPTATTNLSCGESFTKVTNEGKWDMKYTCFPTYATTPWSFKISSTVQYIIVSNVTEDGLWWWRNGVRQTKLARHVVPKDYLFHGTMSKMWNGDSISYQDYFTFRHNVGSGGTGSIAIAGSFTVG